MMPAGDGGAARARRSSKVSTYRMGKRAFARMDREFVNEEAIRGTFLKTFRMRTGGWSPAASPALIPAPINAGEGGGRPAR